MENVMRFNEAKDRIIFDRLVDVKRPLGSDERLSVLLPDAGLSDDEFAEVEGIHSRAHKAGLNVVRVFGR